MKMGKRQAETLAEALIRKNNRLKVLKAVQYPLNALQATTPAKTKLEKAINEVLRLTKEEIEELINE